MKKKILITNGRSPMTLEFIRALAARGNEIHVAETYRHHVSRYSNAVTKNFVVASPRFAPEKFIDDVEAILTEGCYDLFVPGWEDVMLISRHLDRLSVHAKVFSSSHEMLMKLHNKASLVELEKELGFKVPLAKTLTSLSDLEDLPDGSYAIKGCYSRGSQKVYKWKKGDLLPPIAPTLNEPWVAQQWLSGKHYCTFGICHDGKLHAHSIYPMDFEEADHKSYKSGMGTFCLAFHSVDYAPIQAWTETFVEKLHYSGLIAFDFIETADGDLFAIDCNPRITSGAALFTEKDAIDEALFGYNDKIVTPSSNVKKQLAFGMLMYGWRTALATKSMKSYFKNLVNCKDLVYHSKDIKPFIAMPFVWIRYLYQSIKWRMNFPSLFTRDIDYNGH